MASSKEVKTMMEGFGEIMTLEETAEYLKIEKSTPYKMARKGKTPAVKIELGRNNRAIIRIPYNQDLINKVKSIPKRKWNPKEKYWEVPYDENLISRIQDLLESGVDLRYIQDLLGHKRSKTTEVYTHVSKGNIANIKSPLYYILKEEV